MVPVPIGNHAVPEVNEEKKPEKTNIVQVTSRKTTDPRGKLQKQTTKVNY
jgi:hypothetical protein